MPTDWPGAPLAGLIPLIAGADGAAGAAASPPAVTVNDASLVTVPAGVTTLIAPLIAASGTFVVICESDTTLKSALVPLKRTAVAPLRPLPPSCTIVPDRKSTRLNSSHPST